MKIDTKAFGEMQVQEEKVITFKDGIPGFEDLKKFILIEQPDGVFHYLQSIEDGDICFIITDPHYFKNDYAPTINESYFQKLGGGDNESFSIYSIVTFKDTVENSTINLAGPLLIHVENRQGVQVIIEDKGYTTKHMLVDLRGERSWYNVSFN